MKTLSALMLSLTLAFASVSAFAQKAPTKGAATVHVGDTSIDKGWFYFEEPPKQDEPTEAPTPVPQAKPGKPPVPKEEKCKKKETWSADCGFINPGEDFEFQAKQRDALMERMSVSNNDPKAVEAFQYYMRWVLERTSQVTNLWWYNMVQNPELDPTAAQPISAMGLRLMTDVRKGAEKEVFDLIKDEGGMFIYFSRSDCAFCHQMVEPLRMLAGRTGLPVRNASLDNQCIPFFKEGCMTAPATVAPAQSLQVTTVPTVFLYVQPNTWIRIATGISDTDSMATRAMQFFTAYRNALLKGVDNGADGRPSVDFDTTEPTGNRASGLSLNKKPALPSEDDIAHMLGQKK